MAGRPMSQTLQLAIAAYMVALENGHSPHEARAAAREALGDRWTPSVAVNLSRYLRQHAQPRPGSGGDRRSPVARAVAEHLHRASAVLKDLRRMMGEEVTQAERRAQHVWARAGTSAETAQDARRLLHRPGLRPSARRLYDVAALEAPVVAAQEDWAGIRAYWEDEMAAVRRDTWAAIQPLLADASDKEAHQLLARVERILGPAPGAPEDVPVITAWRGDRLPDRAIAIDLWADNADEDVPDFGMDFDELGGKRQSHYAGARTRASLQARQIWQSL